MTSINAGQVPVPDRAGSSIPVKGAAWRVTEAVLLSPTDAVTPKPTNGAGRPMKVEGAIAQAAIKPDPAAKGPRDP